MTRKIQQTVGLRSSAANFLLSISTTLRDVIRNDSGNLVSSVESNLEQFKSEMAKTIDVFLGK